MGCRAEARWRRSKLQWAELPTFHSLYSHALSQDQKGNGKELHYGQRQTEKGLSKTPARLRKSGPECLKSSLTV